MPTLYLPKKDTPPDRDSCVVRIPPTAMAALRDLHAKTAIKSLGTLLTAMIEFSIENVELVEHKTYDLYLGGKKIE